MHTYLIEPKAPLVIRSGRPFDEQAGTDSARFPPPSTLAGALRTAHAETSGKSFGPELATLAVAGPLPVKLDTAGEPKTLLVPRPADALYFWSEDRQSKRLARIAPTARQRGEGCDLPEGLLPVQLTLPIKGKPASGPGWWALEDLIVWQDPNRPEPEFPQIEKRGWAPMADDVRTHVAIQRDTQAADAGRLFQTAGLGFWEHPQDAEAFPRHATALIGRMAGDIAPGVITLGGERRLSALRSITDELWPARPADFVASVRAAGGLRLTLLTPALFSEGWRPGGLRGLSLRAAALDRWQPHSGWDLARQQPRAGRKLVPAGAVYWFELGDIDDEALANLWLAPISDDPQDRLDGFGLALPQAWTPPHATN